MILVLVFCFAFIPVFQVQGQVDSKPEIVDLTQEIPITGNDFTIMVRVTDNDGVDTVRIYAYFRIFDDVSNPEYLNVIETSSGVYQATLNVPINASLMKYNVWASDDNGVWNVSDVLEKEVQDNYEPLAAVSSSSVKINLGTPYQFNGSSSQDNIGISYYNWTFTYGGETVTLSGAEPTFNFTIYGSYILTLKVTDAWGNWDTDSITVVTLDIISPVANPGAEQFEMLGNIVIFDGSSSTDNVAIGSYTWTFYHNGTLITLNGQNASFRFWELRDYNVTLEVTDGAGNSDETTYTIHVLTENIPPDVSEEVPWWTFALMIMVIAVIVTTLFIFKTSDK